MRENLELFSRSWNSVKTEGKWERCENWIFFFEEKLHRGEIPQWGSRCFFLVLTMFLANGPEYILDWLLNYMQLEMNELMKKVNHSEMLPM